MSTRNQARRHKGATRQVKGPGWTEYQRAVYDDERRLAEDAVLGLDEVRETHTYWRDALGPQATFVYFAASYGQKAIKIGYAANPITRLAELQCGNPADLFVAGLLLGSRVTERTLHRHWASTRVRGEWFGRDGYADAILVLAEAIAEMQLIEHRRGFGLAYICDQLPSQMLGTDPYKERV